MNIDQRRAIIFLIVTIAVATPCIAQSTTEPTSAPASAATPNIPIPAEFDWLLDGTTIELRYHLVPLTHEDLDSRVKSAIDALKTTTAMLADTAIEHLREASAESSDADRLANLTRRLEAIRTLRDRIVTRTNIVIAEAEAKGCDVATARNYVSVVQRIEPPDSETIAEDELSEEDLAAAELAERVTAAVTRIREMPPVHERPEPWTIGVSELELELQPLRKDQIDDRVRKWVDILQRELRQRIRMDIALEQATDDAERQALADRSAAQQQVVQAIVERIRAMLVILQKRGGETQEYQDYIANATGQRLNLTNPSVLMAQVKSWLRSPNGGIAVGLAIIKFVAILVAFWIGSRIAAFMMRAAVRRIPKSSALLQRFASDVTRGTVMIIGVVVAASALGVTIGPLIAAIGAAGLVIGLALQGTLSNFASGVLILMSRPFDVGDVISAGGVFGKVDAMNVVSTRLLTFDNQVMLVPNNQIWNGVITNLTKLDTRRVDLVFGISYGDDIARATQVIEEVVKQHPKVLPNPAPMIKVNELADSSVNLIVRPWSKTVDYWDVYWDLTRQIKERFDAENISIPFPQRDIHLYTNSGAIPTTSGSS